MTQAHSALSKTYTAQRDELVGRQTNCDMAQVVKDAFHGAQSLTTQGEGSEELGSLISALACLMKIISSHLNHSHDTNMSENHKRTEVVG
jgi:hypothetical protein